MKLPQETTSLNTFGNIQFKIYHLNVPMTSAKNCKLLFLVLTWMISFLKVAIYHEFNSQAELREEDFPSLGFANLSNVFEEETKW